MIEMKIRLINSPLQYIEINKINSKNEEKFTSTIINKNN